MKEIKMVDLYSQYTEIKEEIDNAIQSVIDKTSFVKGTEVNSFEKELATYLSVKHVISCGNGTDALQIALMALGLKPGDEVITTTFTFIATAEVIALLKLNPVLIDIDPNTFLIDVKTIENAITNKTKAILPVHLFGQCANMEIIMEIARKHNLYVVEDVAQALGSDFYFSDGTKAKAGTIGHIGCTSFFPSKNLGCFGDGGALYTNDEDLAKKIRSIANHGMTQRYYHDHIGINSRLDSLQAAILSVKLKKLDNYHKRRQEAAAYYDRELSGLSWLQIPQRVSWSNHIFHQYSIILKNAPRDEFKNYLEKNNIPSMIYYPVPIHLQKAYEQYKFNITQFVNANFVSQNIISLPMHTELSNDQLLYICETIKKFKP
ncbi:MAG: DegT/DnrJ/EryC1/StrS family aminotransferase [Bacteroidales bacterium]|nr:DegT/DnrJ/EryC1/StrS family aminotransferase [Bacteroidales bacterium]